MLNFSGESIKAKISFAKFPLKSIYKKKKKNDYQRAILSIKTHQISKYIASSSRDTYIADHACYIFLSNVACTNV